MRYSLLYITFVNSFSVFKKLISILIVTYLCSGSEYSVMFTKRDTNDYVISHSQPQMTAITTCFWVNTTQTKGNGHYVSYVTSFNETEFAIWQQYDVTFAVGGTGITASK